MMKLSPLTKKVLGVVATVLIVAALLSIPKTNVLASDPYMDANIPSAGGITNKDIELMNKHEITWLINQNQVFRDANQVEKDFQTLMNDEKKKRGTDFPVLIIALGSFDTDMLMAKSIHDQAAKVVGAQWGFDASGHVQNREAALQTVTNARLGLRDAHYRMVVCTHTLHRAYIDWHKQFAPR